VAVLPWYTTGATYSFAEIIRMGYVGALLSGNALAVHDVEYALYGTSLGMDLDTGMTTANSRNHIAAINEVLEAGSLRAMVEQGRLKSGIFFQCIRNRRTLCTVRLDNRRRPNTRCDNRTLLGPRVSIKGS